MERPETSPEVKELLLNFFDIMYIAVDGSKRKEQIQSNGKTTSDFEKEKEKRYFEKIRN